MAVIHLFILLLFIQISSSLVNGQYIQCKDGERQALLEIKQELVDEYNHLSSWSPDERNRDCCKWRGVLCSNHNGHVLSLDLHVTDYTDNFNPLRGNISLSIFKLQHLRYLDLSHNDFKGNSIPAFNQSFPKLRYLNLSSSNFSGALDYHLANLSNLESLDLSWNYGILYRSGSIAWLLNFSSLKTLKLSSIDLGAAKDLFQVLNTLTSLTELRLAACNLSSVIPQPIAIKNSSSSLKVIDLSKNKFTNSIFKRLTTFQANISFLALSDNILDGLLPSSLGNISSLTHLDLSLNTLKGGIPKSFSRLCSLQALSLGHNGLGVNLSDLVHNMTGCLEKSLKMLDLNGNQLLGLLPDFEAFSSLRGIALGDNLLGGSIPDKLFQSSKLAFIQLFGNQLSGSLPDVTMSSSLKKLSLWGNQLNGSLPKSIGHLSDLELLDLSENSLQGTVTEAHFAKLSKLKRLDLSGNSLSLKCSLNYTPPFHLDEIILRSCNLGPEFPRWLRSQDNCSVLDISDAHINDTIPGWFWDFSSRLVEVNLSSNSLHGQLPDLSSKFPGEKIGIDFSSNLLDGPLPRFPPNTTSLKLSQNNFSGNISTLCHIKADNLNLLDLSDNFLNGTLPGCFRQSSLEVLSLANNNFTGMVPESFTYSKILDLHNNGFYGELPSAGLRTIKYVAFLDLSSNRFSGELSTYIGQGPASLMFLSLKSNLIGGKIPDTFCQLQNVQILDLSANKISGTIPRCVNNLTAMIRKEDSSESVLAFPFFASMSFSAIDIYYVSETILGWKRKEHLYGGSILRLLRAIDLSSNHISGKIPEEITGLVELKSLNLSRNRLEGSIPEDIRKLKQVEVLDFSNNHLSGSIPASISDLHFLSLLDLSNNSLSGEIPMGTQIQGFSASSFEGNPRLCGPPLSKKCNEENSPTGSEDLNNGKNDDEFLKRIFAGIGLGFAMGFGGVCVVPMLRASWRHSYLQFLDYLMCKLHVTH